MSQIQTNAGKDNGNDLTAIKGIGPARQQWFKESLNVSTYEDLAALSAEDVETRLKAEGRIASRGEIEQWIAQASQWATENAQEPRAEVPENSNPSKMVNAALKVDGWKPFASFVVEFRERQLGDQPVEKQTIVHHVESDTGQTWLGLEKRLLCQWMIDQISEEDAEVGESKAADVEVSEKKAASTARRIPAELKVNQVCIYQPPDSERPVATGLTGESFEGWIEAQMPFSLEAKCELSGPAAAEAADGELKYQALYFASAQTGKDVQIGDSQTAMLAVDQTSYQAILPEATLQPGLYHLRVVAKIEGAARLGYAQISGLQVK